MVRRTWAPCGKTPVLETKTRSHKKISAIGGIAATAKGRKARLLFRLHPGKNVGGAECVAFLEQLKLNFKGRHIFVIWDGLRAHWGRKVLRWKKRHPKIHLFRLPSYAPELNPMEYGWGHLKYHQLANLAPETEEELFRHAKRAICNLRRRPDLILIIPASCADMFFFQMNEIIYAGINRMLNYIRQILNNRYK